MCLSFRRSSTREAAAVRTLRLMQQRIWPAPGRIVPEWGPVISGAAMSARMEWQTSISRFSGGRGCRKKENIQMHNRWNLEFDIDHVPG